MALDPENWAVSQVCEAFGCTPRAAIRELTEDPERRALAIMELRAYVQTRAAMNAAQKPEDVPTGPMADWVKRVMAVRVRERMGESG
jgi:hypothetical protein